MDKKDLKIEYMRGTGKGGQHKNKTDSCVRITHKPTGISAIVDGRNQHQNKKAALKELEKKLEKAKSEKTEEKKKAERDRKIKEHKTIRTYDFNRGVVKDHRTGKTASLKNILEKGKLDLLKD